jgi:hypothetical protein
VSFFSNASGCRPVASVLQAVVAIAVLGFLGLFYLGGVAKEIRGTKRSVTVKGFAEKPIQSDYAIWTMNLVARSTQISEAYATMERNLAKVLEYLKKEGVKDEEVTYTAATIQVRYRMGPTGMPTNEIEIYEMNQSVSVRSPDVHQVAKVSKGVTFLLRDGVELQSWEPAFHYTKLNDLKIEMLGGAAADARLRAKAIAEKGGSKLGRLLWAQQGVFQITPIYSSEISSEGWFDTSSIDKTIRAVVTVKFELK